MGKYGFGTGLGGGTASYDSGPLTPMFGVGGGTSSSSFGQRGAPERLAADQLLPQGYSMEQALGEAVKAPASILESPLALGAELLGMPKGETLLDPVTSFFEDLPIVGNTIRDIGKDWIEPALQRSTEISRSFLNSGQTRIFQDLSTLQSSDTLRPSIQEALQSQGMPNVNDATTVAEVRAWASELGYDTADWDDLAANRKGWFDYADKKTSTAAADDFLATMLTDPINIGFALASGGGGLIVKAGVMAGRMVTPVSAATRATLISQSAARATKGLLTAVPLADTASAAAIAAGQASKATLGGFSMFLKNLVRAPRTISVMGKSGRATPFGWYRRVAVGTKASQVSVNMLDEIVPDDSVLQDVLDPVFGFAARMGDRKPLSNNDLFVALSLFGVPARSMAASGGRWTKGKLDAKRQFGHRNAVLTALYPDLAPKAGLTRLADELGSVTDADDFLAQVIGAGVHHKYYNEGVAPARYSYGSLSEAGFLVKAHLDSFLNTVKWDIERGAFGAQDAVAGLEWIAQRGGAIGEMAGGLQRYHFDPQDAIRGWKAFSPVAKATSSVMPGGSPIMPGLQRDVILEDRILYMKDDIDRFAVDGQISGELLARLVDANPAILGSKYNQKFTQAITRQGPDAMFPVKGLKEDLDNILAEEATTRAEYFASAATYDGLATKQQTRRLRAQHMLEEDGTPAYDVRPANGMADVTVMTASGKAARQNMSIHGMPYSQFMHTMRGVPAVAEMETHVPYALGLGGSNILGATQVGLFERSSTRSTSIHMNTGLSIRYSPLTPWRDIVEDATLSLEHTGADRARVMLTGKDALQAQGLQPNGTLLQWEVGRRLPAAARDELAVTLEKNFGDLAVYNDTVGLVQVIVPGGAKLDKALATMEKLHGQPTRDAAHYSDIVNRKKVTKHDPAGSVTLRDSLAVVDRRRRAGAKRAFLTGVDSSGLGRLADGPYGPGRSSAEAGVRGADRPASGVELTRWQRGHGGRIQAGPEQQPVVLDDAAKIEFEPKLNEAGLRDTNPDLPFTFRPGDTLYATASRDAGAVVRNDGELILWLKSTRAGRQPADPDFGAVINAASEQATWARTLARRDSRGVTPIDHLAEHGWAPVAQSIHGDDLIAWLVHDPDQFYGRIPTQRISHKGGWGAMVEDNVVPTLMIGTARGKVEKIAAKLYPERVVRVKQAAADETLLRNLQRLEEVKASLAATPGSKKLQAEYQALLKTTSTKASKARTDAILKEQFPPGQIKYVEGVEDDLEIYRPRMDESIEGNYDQLAPDKLNALTHIEAGLRRDGGFYDDAGEWVDGYDYTLKVIPKHGTPYYIGQGEAYKAIFAGREAMYGTVRDRLTSGLSHYTDLLVGRRYSRKFNSDAAQEMYNGLLNAGATMVEARAFRRALETVWDEQSQFLGMRLRKNMHDLSPNLINAIARGEKMKTTHFPGFTPATQAKVGDFADLMQRAGSRTFRDLARKYPAKPGSGNLGHLIETWYGAAPGATGLVAKGVRRATFNAAFLYHMMRFVLDPRYYAMQLFESDILSAARYGHKTIRDARAKSLVQEIRGEKGRPIRRDQPTDILAGRRDPNAMLSPEDILHADQYASGWIDSRNLYGYYANIGAAQRPQATRRILQKIIDDSAAGDVWSGAVIRDLKDMFGGDTSVWIKEIEDQLYNIDTIGVRATVLKDAVAQQMRAANVPQSKAYGEFLDGVFRAHTKGYQDIVHTLHGNVNRANLERIMNSPFLWWPISYQLKVGKWVIDLLTKQVGGIAGPELLGTFGLATLLSKHSYFMENSEEYRSAMEGHPALWRALAMMLPMTPFDVGVNMARMTRYGTSWMGAQLGLWDEDPTYPQDPVNFMIRAFSLGPAYSVDIIKDITEEFE